MLDITNEKYISLHDKLKKRVGLQSKLEFILSNVISLDPALLRPRFKKENDKLSKNGHPFLDFYEQNCIDKVSDYRLEKTFRQPKRKIAVKEETEEELNKKGIYTDADEATRAGLRKIELN